MDTANRQLGAIRRRLISIVIAALGIIGAAPALADSALATCGFTYQYGFSFSDSSDSRGNSAVTCSDARFGTISSSATVSGTKLGAYVGINWNSPPTRVPDDGYGASARANLYDTLSVAGTGTGIMTVSMPVHGLIANSPYFNTFAMVVLQAGDNSGDGSNVWQNYFYGSVGQTFIVPLTIPLGQSFAFYTQLQIWGGNVDGHGAPYTDGVADFSNTVEISITRLRNAAGADIPLSNLEVTSGSGRVFTVPVPEPETYAMLLAGLGLMGFVARRRKQRTA